jgi:phage regulator Rha-like protein
MTFLLQVARHFGKQHNNVLHDICRLIEELSDEWRVLNLQPIDKSVLLPHFGGIRKDLACLLTRDGFTLLSCEIHGKAVFGLQIPIYRQIGLLLRS